MLYHTTTILLFRPFISHARSKLLPEPLDPLGLCTNSAANIVTLVKAYRRDYSLRHIVNIAVHTVFTAATIHLSNITSTNVSYGANARQYLESCTEILERMGETWPSALRSLHVVHSLMVKYGAIGASSAADTQEEPSPKDYTYAERQEQRLLGSFATMPQLQRHSSTFAMQDPAAWAKTANSGAPDPVAPPTGHETQPCDFIATDFDMSFFDVPDLSLFNAPLFTEWSSSFSFSE
jgi:hypothetical protein